MPAKGFRSVTVKNETVEDVERILAMKLGYTSRASIIADAVRHLQKEAGLSEQKKETAPQ